MKKTEWINHELLESFKAEETSAHRLCTVDNGWAERFGADVLVSFRTDAARDRLVSELAAWTESVDFQIDRVFGRFLPRKNEERETPKLLSGSPSEILQSVATENNLKFGIDFGAGYSVGLFVDQRENRRLVTETQPQRMLNCFAYTCAFSVSAASIGAGTVNLDLSKKSLERGRENFA